MPAPLGPGTMARRRLTSVLRPRLTRIVAVCPATNGATVPVTVTWSPRRPRTRLPSRYGVGAATDSWPMAGGAGAGGAGVGVGAGGTGVGVGTGGPWAAAGAAMATTAPNVAIAVRTNRA